MASRYGSLVKQAIVLLDKFNIGRQCLDDFMEDASKDLQDMNTLHKKFILDVVSGCIEHKELLDVVIDVFYGVNGRSLFRADRSQFIIISYLTIFDIDDLGLQRFSNIVKSLDVKKMYQFLFFFFTNLTTWIQKEWNNVYDAAYVEKHWIGPLLRWRPDVIILIDQLAAKVSQGSQLKKAPIKTIEIQEFSLTKPKPPTLPMPELIPQQEKCKPVPNSTYRAPKEMQMMEEIKQCNHHKNEELLYEANRKQFRCVNPQKSERTRRVMSQIKEELDSKLQFNSRLSSVPPPNNKTNSWPIKLNSAAILRQGALYDRQVEEQRQRMERLVEGAREPSSFLLWQKEMREKDLQEELAKIERRRLEGRISYEEAAMARNRIMERNQKTTQLKKEETAQLMRQYADKRLREEEGMRDLVQQVLEGHKNSKSAKEKLQKFKLSIAKEVSEQGRELLRQALEDAQVELSRRFQIINEIRAMESLPHAARNFDNTEIAGHELLGEMSLAELKERLALLKEEQQAEKWEKMELILEEKQNKKQLLLEQLDTIDLHRRALAQAANIRKEKRKGRLGSRQTVTQDETVLALQRKLEEKQRERKQLRESKSGAKAKTSEQATVHTDTHADNGKRLKERTWDEVERSLEHHIQKDAPYAVSLTETLKT